MLCVFYWCENHSPGSLWSLQKVVQQTWDTSLGEKGIFYCFTSGVSEDNKKAPWHKGFSLWHRIVQTSTLSSSFPDFVSHTTFKDDDLTSSIYYNFSFPCERFISLLSPVIYFCPFITCFYMSFTWVWKSVNRLILLIKLYILHGFHGFGVHELLYICDTCMHARVYIYLFKY